MKATVKLYKNDGSKSNTFPIKLIVTHRQKIKRVTIGMAAEMDWDVINELPKSSHPDFESLYGRVMDIRAKAVKQSFKLLTDLTEAVSYFEGTESKEVPNFYAFAKDEIKRMYLLGRDGNAVAYNTAVSQLQKFRPQLNFKDLDSYIMENFKRHKVMEGVKNSTVRTYINEIKAIYNTGVRLGMCEDKRPFVGVFSDLPVRKRRARNEYLSAESLCKMRDTENITVRQRMAVDLSMLQFYLGGLNLVDIYYLQESQFSDGRVFLKRKKLGEKGYFFDLKLFDEANEIIERYKKPVKGYVFPWIKDRKVYQSFRHKHNSCLERVQKKLEIDILPNGGKLTSNILRHTFATLAKFKHIDVDIIRELMGHERHDIDTVYKDRFPEKVRDKAHRNIIDI